MSARFGDERLPERFWNKVEPEPNTGCWLWSGADKRNGYGQITISGKKLSVHRLAFTVLSGAIPAGLDLDHLCRVRCCVNPEHLEPVTRQTNLLRGQTYPARNAAKATCPKGHAYDRLVRRGDGSVGRGCRVCSRETNGKYRKNNAEKVAARKLAYARANREKVNAYHRAYYLKQKETA